MAIRSREIGRAVVSLRTDDTLLTKGLKKARMSMRNFGGSLKSAGMAATTAGASMVGMATAAAAPFALAIRSGMSFQKTMSAVKAITGATGEDFDNLTAKAKELGRTTSFTASQVGEGMQFLGMAGFSPDQIQASIGAVLNLAKAGNVELGLAADIASDVGTAFGLSADEIVRVTDVIAKAATSANTTVEMMGETFKKSAPIARAAGQSLEEVSAAAGLLGNAMVKAGVAGIDIKNILGKIADKSSQKKIEKYAGSVKDANGNMLPMLDILRNMKAGMEGMTGMEKLSAMMDIFGKISAKSALILMNTGEQADIMRDKMENAAGSAAAMARIMSENTTGAFERLMSAIEGVAIEIHDALEPALMQVMGTFARVAGNISELIEKHPKLVQKIGAVIISIGAIGAALTTFGIALGVTGMAVSGLATVIGLLATPLGAVGTAAAVLVTAFVLAQVDIRNQIGIISDGLDGLVETMKKAGRGLTDAINAKDWTLAGEIAIAALNVAMLKGMKTLKASMIAAAKDTAKGMWKYANPFTAIYGLSTSDSGMDLNISDAQDKLDSLVDKAAARSAAKKRLSPWEQEGPDPVEEYLKKEEEKRADFEDKAWDAEMDRIEKRKKERAAEKKKEADLDLIDDAWEAEMRRIDQKKDERYAERKAKAKLAAEEEANLLANAPDLGQGVFDHRMLQDYTKGIGIPGVQNMLGKPALMNKEEKKEKTQEEIRDAVKENLKINKNREAIVYEANNGN